MIFDKKFEYISPWIYPIMPKESGKTVLSHDLQSVFYDAAPNLDDVDCNVTFEVWYKGEVIDNEIIELKVRNKKVSPEIINREYSLDGYGFLNMSITACEPYFRKLELEKGYALLMRPKGSFTTVIPQAKYADLIIIQNMRRTGVFCLVHPAHYYDSLSDTGNSAFLVNPYEAPLVASILNQDGKKLKKRIMPGFAEMVSLEPLLNDKEPSCIMYSGSNRIPGWDVRHSILNPKDIKHFDHLEYFRPSKTYSTIEPVKYFKAATKRVLREFGYII